MLTDEQIEDYFKDLHDRLVKNGPKLGISLTSDWITRFPDKPGIYVVFEGANLVYVGETGNLRGRMRDLRDSRHHNLRRNIGRFNFSQEAGYEDASDVLKFPKHIEEKVDEWLKEKIEISVLVVELGRKELEENIIKKYDPKYNKKGQRKSG